MHLLQIRIHPESGINPGYDEKHFSEEDRLGRLPLVIASPDGRDGSIRFHQDGLLYATVLSPGEAVAHELQGGREAYVHVVRGEARVNDEVLGAGDAARVRREAGVRIEATGEAEVLLFDLTASSE